VKEKENYTYFLQKKPNTRSLSNNQSRIESSRRHKTNFQRKKKKYKSKNHKNQNKSAVMGKIIKSNNDSPKFLSPQVQYIQDVKQKR